MKTISQVTLTVSNTKTKICDLLSYIIRSSFIMFYFFWASRCLVYSSLHSSYPVWESPLFVTVPWLWTLLHREEPPLCPLHQSIHPSDQFTQWVLPVTFHSHMSRNDTSSSLAINRKVKQMLLRVEWFAFHWPLCEWSHRPVNTWSSNKECTERLFIP